MLIHGRLLVTHNGLLLDEVRSLLQKALRRQELGLVREATKELIGHGKDQLPWKSLVTFLFEDHCLSDVNVLKMFCKLYRAKDKYRTVELLGKCYTCRLAACLQVVALTEKYKPNDKMWLKDIPLEPALTSLVQSRSGGIDFDVLLAHIVKYIQEKNATALISLFLLVNMAAKVENRTLTQKGMKYLLGSKLRKPTVYQLVLTVIYKHTTDNYVKQYTLRCFELSTIADVPAGLIVFSIVPQIMHMDVILKRLVGGISHEELGSTNYRAVGRLKAMPTWAVDKHTYRGKFGRETKHLFLKKFKEIDMSAAELDEFHGERPKSDIRVFFDVGCVCNNDILPENPYWEQTKQMYLSRPKSLQKTAKMTQEYFYDLKKQKCVVFTVKTKELTKAPPSPAPRKRKSQEPSTSGSGATTTRKKLKLEQNDKDTTNQSKNVETKTVKKDVVETAEHTRTDPPSSDEPSTSRGMFKNAASASKLPVGVTRKAVYESKKEESSIPDVFIRLPGPLLQLPTGSGKVYTILDMDNMKVVKGPYRSRARKNLCVFYHRAMLEVFKDKHTLQPEKIGHNIKFPLVRSETATMQITKRAFYDCIAKRDISETEGEFITRESLGITQLHKIPLEKIQALPVTVWAHFVYRYVLNIGDTGLYNAITTDDYKHIYGIDMEENRSSVKGHDIMNRMFGKLPKRSTAAVVERSIVNNKEEFLQILYMCSDFDFDKLRYLYEYYQFDNEVSRCRKRLETFRTQLESTT